MLDAGSVGEFISAFIAALMCTVMVIVFAFADASVLFGAALSQYLPVAVSMTMMSAVILALMVAVLSEFQGVIAGSQKASIVVLAIMVAGIHTSMQATGGLSESAIVATVVASVLIATILLGLAFWAVGTLRYGRFIRYIPFPVIVGFLAGTGILMIKFGFVLALGFNPFSDSFTDVFTVQVLAKVAVTLVMVGLLFWASGKGRSKYSIPVLVILAVVVFLLATTVTGTGLASWIDTGWMLVQSAQQTVYPPLQFSDFDLIEWKVVAAQVPQMVILIVICIIDALVKISAMEVILSTDVDPEGELKVIGYGNFFSGVFGGALGFHSLSLTRTVKRMHVELRLVGILVAFMTLIAFMFSADLLLYMPRFVFGGIVIWVGVDLVIDFFLRPMQTLRKLEIATILLMVFVIVLFGFLPAMLIGLIAGGLLFIIDFSRIDVVQQQYSGHEIHSNVDRPIEIRQLLAEHGQELQVFRISGFLFFGTSYRLVQQVRESVDESMARSARFLILDFEKVVRIDSSARVSLSRLGAFADSRNLTFLVSGAKADVKVALELSLCADDGNKSPQFFDSLDSALEWYEHWQLNDQKVETDTGRRVGLHEWVGFDFNEALMSQMFKYLTPRLLAAEEILFSKGDLVDGMYLVRHGSLDVVVDTDKAKRLRLRKVGPGAVLGEVSLYLNQPASASVVATQKSEVLHFTRENLTIMLTDNPSMAAPFHERMARVLAYRLSDNSHY